MLTRTESTFRVGFVSVVLSTPELPSAVHEKADEQLRLLARMIQGLADGKDLALFAQLLNGETLDAVLERRPSHPCGCRGKAKERGLPAGTWVADSQSAPGFRGLG